MPTDVICADCSAKRSNAAYKNTRYCKSCRLLRDFDFIGDRTRKCREAGCSTHFAPVDRRDPYCGEHGFGSLDVGYCINCKQDAELHRAGIPVCNKCVRDPARRRWLLGGLKKGQLDRRQANAHVPLS